MNNLSAPFDRDALIKNIRKGILGQFRLVSGPYGQHRIVYSDWVASGRALSFIEDYIRDEVLPLYSNTHTTSSFLGHQTSLFVEEARTIIAHSVNARYDKDAVIFTGNGATAAVNHLIRSMGLWPDRPELPDDQRPVVFVSLHEHHSNLLPWRESQCTVVSIPEDPVTGEIDLVRLEQCLIEYQNRPLKIGSFSAASNVTGIVQDVPTICKLLHRYQARSFWDFATAGPHILMDMNPIAQDPQDRGLVYADALFLSPHKFLGGICTPGILVVKKNLISRDAPPYNTGGGAVKFVTPQSELYLNKLHEREEAGTPNIIGCIRAGLVFQLKYAVGSELIGRYESLFFARATQGWMGNPYIHILGPPANAESGSTGPRRLPIISFVVYHRSGKLLHYNFVCTLLNDLFGIQTRGGCVCAGPYGQHLLGIDLELAQLFEEQVDKYKDTEVLRPGFVRVCFNYFTEEEEVDYVIAAVNFVAREGWKLLPEYTFQTETNEWYHLSNRTLPGRRWLGEISYASGEMKYPRYEYLEKEVTTGEMSSYLDKAAEIVEDAERRAKAHHHFSELTQEQWLMREDAEALRWFVYPDEAYLVKIDIEEPSSDCLVGNAMNYHNPEWRERWASLCPLVPRYYAVSGMGESGERARLRYAATLVPKTDRSTSAIRGGSKSEEAAFGSVAGLCAMAQSPGDGDIGGVSPELPNELRGEDSSIIGAESADSDQRCAEPSGGTCSDGVAACRPGRASVKSLVEKRRAATAHSMRQSGNELLRQRRTSFWDEEKKSKLTRQHDPLQYTEYRVFKRMVAAIREFDLIQPGDRILVAVSGGKDSLTLLNMMLKARRHLPFKYEVAAITVDPQTLEYDPSPLKNYMAQLGIEYFYDSQPLISIAGEINPSSICSWCSRMKRGILHNACERYGYNVLALGQHLDDLVESFFMYSFHNGKLDTMKAATIVRDGRLKIIRPFVFVRERDTKDYANLSNLPVITENCPACFEEPKERSRIKALLKAQERLYPGLFGNLQSSIKPLMHPDLHLDKILLQLEASAKATKNQKYFPKQQDRP